MKIPEPTHTISTMIDDYHQSKQGKPRPHLGCSIVGHPCERWIWLGFRWAVIEKFEGRILRLFRRGQNEEDVIVSDLRAIGIDIRHTGNPQRKVDFRSHVGGSLDGVIESGVPEAPQKRHIAEFKTHSRKSFDDLQKKGVKEAKPQHWMQMQLYMHGTQIDRALYLAVCKDSDRIYTERVKYDREAAEKGLAKAKRLALADRMPPPVSTDPSWYQCKFCPAYSFCHQQKPTQEANCRTCAHSTALENGSWRCERHESDGIPYEFQLQGCDDHVIHPDLVPWRMEPSEDGNSVTWIIDGRRIENGTGGYASREILAGSDFIGTPEHAAVLAAFPGAELI